MDAQEPLSWEELAALAFADGSGSDCVPELLELLDLLDLESPDPFASLTQLEQEMMLLMMQKLGLATIPGGVAALLQEPLQPTDGDTSTAHPLTSLIAVDLNVGWHAGGGVRLQPPRLMPAASEPTLGMLEDVEPSRLVDDVAFDQQEDQRVPVILPEVRGLTLLRRRDCERCRRGGP